MEELWKIAIGVAGLGGVASFVFWSLYREWLRLSIFQQMTKSQQFSLFRLIIIFTFLFALAGLITFAITTNNANRKISELIKIRPIDHLDHRLETLILPREKPVVNPHLVSNFWPIDYPLSISREALISEVRYTLLEQLALREHTSLDLRQFPAPSNCSWQAMWFLTVNGKIPTHHDDTFASMRVPDGALLQFKLEWSMLCLTAGDSDEKGTKTIIPPDVQL